MPLTTVHWATPFCRRLSISATLGVTSKILPLTNGPRSLIRTTACRLPMVTRTLVLNGKVLCAAVMAFGSNPSPLAVLAPLRALYHEQRPDSETVNWKRIII
ncbi:hypothetical protein DERF_000505 [Dermatophagoides farinae]|uniref:Uncharacterized protein n=1 Tax=Dermatophagoides farinae TaxID=6954 RepID=A0A922LA89_DERFA|nr:hypothetical protein DERF_000505 [Dermatophagoides farinae]